MSHMFRVDYITNHVNGMVESGKIIVIAESHDQAHDLVCQQLSLPPSRTRCDSSKIKPPVYSVENHQSHPAAENKKPGSIRTQRGPAPPPERFFVKVEASNVNGYDEQQVMRKVGEELCARGTKTKLRHNLQMSVDVSPGGQQTHGSAMSPMEKIEMYGARNGGVQGGQVRGR